MNKFFILFTLLVTCLSTTGQQKPLFRVENKFGNSGGQTLEEVKQLILSNYYYDGITSSDLEWAALEGMLRHISPPETPDLGKLWTDKEYEGILNSLRGVKVTMGFIGTFNSQDGSFTVTEISKGSQAESVLKRLDRIVRINDQSLKGLTNNALNKLLDGELGSIAKLKVVRDISILDIKLSREKLKVENLITSILPQNQAALIEIKSITSGISEELKASIEILLNQGVDHIILDLRNNLGGVLNEGVLISKLFVKKNDIVLRTQSQSNGVKNYVAETDQFSAINLTILVNEKTASAAEIVVSAMKDHNRATIIGRKTFGKGVIETTFTLKNNYRVKFITNAMYSPKGKSWQANGLEPDLILNQSQQDYLNTKGLLIGERISRDVALAAAIKLIQ